MSAVRTENYRYFMFATTSPQLPIPYSKLGSTKLQLFQSFNVKHLKMKPTVVAQDEMFPDGDAGWMEMDEVTTVLYKAL